MDNRKVTKLNSSMDNKMNKNDIVFILMEEGYGTYYSKKYEQNKSPYYDITQIYNINNKIINIIEQIV